MPGSKPDTTQPEPRTLPFSCHLCSAASALHKHLGTHLLRRHALWSPARHFAVAPFCVACMRWFHDVHRVQTHLKVAPACLLRASLVISPLSQDEFLRLEDPGRRRRKAPRQGQWSQFRSVEPSTAYYGPRLPTSEERFNACDDSITLAELTTGFRPCHTTVSWVRSYVAEASVEGPRDSHAGFWHREALLKQTPSHQII